MAATRGEGCGCERVLAEVLRGHAGNQEVSVGGGSGEVDIYAIYYYEGSSTALQLSSKPSERNQKSKRGSPHQYLKSFCRT